MAVPLGGRHQFSLFNRGALEPAAHFGKLGQLGCQYWIVGMDRFVLRSLRHGLRVGRRLHHALQANHCFMHQAAAMFAGPLLELVDQLVGDVVKGEGRHDQGAQPHKAELLPRSTEVHMLHQHEL